MSASAERADENHAPVQKFLQSELVELKPNI